MENLVNRAQLQSYYEGKKVLLTGHTGFKGAWLMAWLEELGAHVTGYALDPEYEACLFNLLKPGLQGKSIIADIRNRERVQETVLSEQPDYIFHLAAQPLVRRSYLQPTETFDVNAVGTANLLEAVKSLDKPCIVVLITTDKVYENKEQDVLYAEDDALGGFDPYSASKACTELVIQSFRRSFFPVSSWHVHQKSLVSARAGNVIGGGDFSEDRILPDIARALRKDEPVLVRNPESVRPWQHVLEPLGAYLLLGGLLHQNPTGFSDAYNFGPYPDDHLTVRELVGLSISNWGKGEWIDGSTANQPHEAKLLKLDISRAMRELNWKPKLNAADAIAWTINWYKQDQDQAASYTIEQIKRYMEL